VGKTTERPPFPHPKFVRVGATVKGGTMRIIAGVGTVKAPRLKVVDPATTVWGTVSPTSEMSYNTGTNGLWNYVALNGMKGITY
jgi:hypothetical protein